MTEIAIIGDRFMLPDAFAAALRPVVGPSVPAAHARAAVAGRADGPRLCRRRGWTGLKEYQGDPDAIAEFIGEAQILVDHLAPVTGAMLDRLPELKLIAVSRGGPVNIDMKRGARARRAGRQHAGPQRLGGGRVHHRRHPGRDPPDPRRPRGAAPGRLARRSLPRRPHRHRAVRADGRPDRLRR